MFRPRPPSRRAAVRGLAAFWPRTPCVVARRRRTSTCTFQHTNVSKHNFCPDVCQHWVVMVNIGPAFAKTAGKAANIGRIRAMFTQVEICSEYVHTFANLTLIWSKSGQPWPKSGQIWPIAAYFGQSLGNSGQARATTVHHVERVAHCGQNWAGYWPYSVEAREDRPHVSGT